jgi:hypothetical protein
MPRNEGAGDSRLIIVDVSSSLCFEFANSVSSHDEEYTDFIESELRQVCAATFEQLGDFGGAQTGALHIASYPMCRPYPSSQRGSQGLGIALAAIRSGSTRAIRSVSQYSSYRAILPSRKWITKA